MARNNWRFNILGNISTVALKRKRNNFEGKTLHCNISKRFVCKRLDIKILGNINTVALNKLKKLKFEGQKLKVEV